MSFIFAYESERNSNENSCSIFRAIITPTGSIIEKELAF